MPLDFDPRAWNLLSGLVLATGCGSHLISSDGGSTESSGSAESTESTDSTDSANDGETTLDPAGTDSGTDSGTDTGPECIDDSDCLYFCYDGMCGYVPQDDGDDSSHGVCDPFSGSGCGLLALCYDYYCDDVPTPPPCGQLASETSFAIPESVLALAFVDLDANGAEELIIATQTELHVYESGLPMPSSHPRGVESDTIDDMVGGEFDGMPGLDVLVLHDDQLALHSSDGLGSLAPAQPSPSPYPSTFGLEAGMFDADPITDLLVSSADTTGLLYGSGELVYQLDDVVSASARELGLPGSGFSLLRDTQLFFVDLDDSSSMVLLQGDVPSAQTGFEASGEILEAGSSVVSHSDGTWTAVEVFDRPTASLTSYWGLLGAVTRMRAGDLDGLDDIDELALIVDDSVTVHVSGECLLPIPLDGLARDVVFGDHDGDGDDELAIRTTAMNVELVDIE